MRLLKRTIACALAAAALAAVVATAGCKYETGPPDYTWDGHGGSRG